MVVGMGGIGQIRDIGDPNDPRRGQTAPQSVGIPGLPVASTTLNIPRGEIFPGVVSLPVDRSDPNFGIPSSPTSYRPGDIGYEQEITKDRSLKPGDIGYRESLGSQAVSPPGEEWRGRVIDLPPGAPGAVVTDPASGATYVFGNQGWALANPGGANIDAAQVLNSSRAGADPSGYSSLYRTNPIGDRGTAREYDLNIVPNNGSNPSARPGSVAAALEQQLIESLRAQAVAQETSNVENLGREDRYQRPVRINSNIQGETAALEALKIAAKEHNARRGEFIYEVSPEEQQLRSERRERNKVIAAERAANRSEDDLLIAQLEAAQQGNPLPGVTDPNAPVDIDDAARKVATQQEILNQLQTYEGQSLADQLYRQTNVRLTPEQAAQTVALLDAKVGLNVQTAAEAVAAGNRPSPELRQSINAQQSSGKVLPAAQLVEYSQRELAKEMSALASRGIIIGDDTSTQATQAYDLNNYETQQNAATEAEFSGDRGISQLSQRESFLEGEDQGKLNRIEGKRNAFKKEKNGTQEPYTVPFLVGTGGRTTGKGGQPSAPTITTHRDERGRSVVEMDTSDARVVQINPAALLPDDVARQGGYMTSVNRSQSETSSYSSTPDVAIPDTSSRVYEDIEYDSNGMPLPAKAIDTGLRAIDDPAYTKKVGTSQDAAYVTSRPMTIGQAVEHIRNKHKTPIATYAVPTDEPGERAMFERVGDNLFALNADGSRMMNSDGSGPVRLYDIEDKFQKESDLATGVRAYRVGNPNMYDSGAVAKEVNQLIQSVTGGKTFIDPIQSGEQYAEVTSQDGSVRAEAANKRFNTHGGQRAYAGDYFGGRDKEVQNMQAQILLDSFSPDVLGLETYDKWTNPDYVSGGPTAPTGEKYTHRAVEQRVNPQVADGAKTGNAFMQAVRLLAKGAQFPAEANGAVTPQGEKINNYSDIEQKAQQLGAARTARREKEKPGNYATWKVGVGKNGEFRAANQAKGAEASIQAYIDQARAKYLDQVRDRGQSPSVLAQNEAAAALNAEIAAKEAQVVTEAAAVSEQNTRAPQAIETGVMNTDDVSMLNAPEPPVIKDEPAPRQRQLEASAPAQETNAASKFLDSFMGRVRRNPGKAAAIAGAAGLGGLGVIPWDPNNEG